MRACSCTYEAHYLVDVSPERQHTHGVKTASARQAPTEPADWMDLSTRPERDEERPSAHKIKRTESSEIRELGGVVGHRTHHPVHRGLPHGIEHAKEDVQETEGI